MENKHQRQGSGLRRDVHTEKWVEKWFAEEFALPIGLFHLIYDGQWRCGYASDSCSEILGCAPSEFWERFCAMLVQDAYDGPAKMVEELLRGAVRGEELGTFLTSYAAEDGVRYIKTTMTPAREGDGTLTIYGMLVDVSDLQKQDTYFRTMEEVYRSSLEMSGRSMYRYAVEGRRGLIPPRTARRQNIPEVIDDLPAWNVACGRIAPQGVEAWLGIFDAIDRGEERGAADVIFSIRGGEQLRRGRVEFLTSFGPDGRPVSAVISHQDITDDYEEELRQSIDRDGLLQVARMTFPEIISVNLTEGTYRMLQYYGATTLGTPREGPLDQMLLLRVENVAPEDQDAFRGAFFTEGLWKAVAEGRSRIQLTYRRRGADGVWHWVETIARRQENPYNSDVLLFAVSHSIDEERARELRLRDQLRQQAEELDLTMSQIGRHLSHYDVSARTLTTRPDTAEKFGVPQVMENFPESFLAVPPKGYPPETGEILREFIGAIRRGDPIGECVYPTVTARGERVWLRRQFATVFDGEGRPVRAVISSEDITDSYMQEEENRQLREQAEETERLFNMVAQHSNRVLYVYDLATRTTRPWNKENEGKDILAHLYTGVYSDEALERNQTVMPDSMGAVKAFFADIHGGVPSGEINAHIRLANGVPKWYHFNYSDIFEGSRPVRALISIEDVTDKHEQEMSHRRFARTISEDVTEHMCYAEADLISDLMEKYIGKHYLTSRSFEGERYTDFWREGFPGLIGTQDAAILYSAENLLRLFRNGMRELDNVWGLRRDGEQMWVRVRVELMEDSYSGHVKIFMVITDVTAEQEERIAVILRADYDAMTSLLRRDVGEKRVRARMAEDSRPGVLVLLDLDDLKGINDSLGHDQGDVAIIGMANAIRSHFGDDDILMRTGGDEFVVFLPGAGEDEEALRNSLASLMEKFSAVSIGKHGERVLRCSVGCAVERKGADTYESLFKRADTALYHVKRAGKDSFAFYGAEMAREDHQSRGNQAVLVTDNAVGSEELRHLLEVVAAKYPGVMLFNLTQNRIRTLSIGSNVKTEPPMGTVEQFWEGWAENIHPEDRPGMMEDLSRESLLALYNRGRRAAWHRFRNRETTGYVWTEVETGLFRSDAGDVCAFLLFRWEPTLGRER